MKLEHLIQAYNFNKIPAKIDKEINLEKERAGTINFFDGIAASYLLDKEEVIISMKIFFNCLTVENKTITNQIDYVLKILNVIQKTIELLGNIPQKEANMILEKIGIFDSSFKDGKKIKHLEHIYGAEIINSLLCFSIMENN